MDILSIIDKKKHGKELTREEINFFVDGIVKTKTIPDYQTTALMMATYFQGFSDKETVYLTDAMLKSGETFTFKKTKCPIVDKHSTGGVGDKVSLILGPILVALGIKVAKL